jgi:hypothetical protein
MFIIEFITTTGKVCESYPTYEEAKRRIKQFPDESLVTMPLIFEELADSSQRIVRDDGKPLQWHRLPDDRLTGPDDPLPLLDVPPELASADGTPLARPVPRPADEFDDDEPLPLAGDDPVAAPGDGG